MPKKFVVYKSSAGSGKTFTLVKEYLKLALGNEARININYKQVLALTFTNKAAAEMRIRIINALISICNSKLSSDIEIVLCKELGIDSQNLKLRGQKLINNLLHHYSDFGVSTIDSFSHKIIKTFAHDLKLPVNFNLETDTKEFYNKVIAKLISEIGSDKEVTHLLKEFALNNINDELSWDPEGNMQEFTKLLQQESSIEHIQELSKLTEAELTQMKDNIKIKIEHYKKTIISEGKKTCELIAQNELNDNDFTYKSSGPQRFFYKCADFEVGLKDIDSSRLQSAIETNKWAAGDACTETKNKVDQLTPKLNEAAARLIAFIRENGAKYNLYVIIYKRTYPMLLLRKIQSITNELKQEEQLVFIEEFNSKIYDFIKNEPVSFIYERLGDRYKHFLIDEFQDTSTLQWHNILPLIENSLADGNFNLIVGDGKQSIYRWRNANVKQFAMLPELENTAHSPNISEQEKALQRNYDEKVLNINYRSYSTIIAFNNALFDHLSKRLLTEPLSHIYKDQLQEIKNKEIGYVTYVDEAKEKDELEDFVCTSILMHIKRALAEQYDYKDICVLADTNKKGSLIATFLSKHNVPVISNDSLLLSNCIEVNVICAFFKFIQNSKDLVSATVILNYLLSVKSISLQQFHKAAASLSSQSFYDIMNALEIAISEIDIQTKNLLDIAVYVIEKMSLNRNTSSNIYLRFMLDEISKYMSSKNSNISEFNLWWEKRSEKASLVISEDLGAVRIMTIHGSKGLEFPIVIVPFCNWDTASKSEQWIQLKDNDLPIRSAYVPFNKNVAQAGYSEEIEKEIQEKTLDNMNKLYVAFTRAIQQLHIISSVSKNNRKTGVNNWLSDFVKNSSLFKKTELGFESGHAQTKNTTHKEKNTFIELSALQTQSNISAVKIKGGFLNNSDLSENAKQKGIIMHYILSKVVHANDVDRALKEVLLEGAISSNEVKELSVTLKKLLHDEKLIPYFKDGLTTKTECDILTETGDILRPDRISISENEVCLIDYKTGKQNNKKHVEQMHTYEKALIKIGYKNIKKLLVYTEELKVIEVY